MYYGLGSSHSARRYSGNHFYFLFLQVLRCFTSLGLALYTYLFSIQFLPLGKRVSPFGDLRLHARAYRSP